MPRENGSDSGDIASQKIGRSEGRSAREQKRHGRRGFVFSVRITERERELLEQAQAAGNGPRRLGPFIVWRALQAGAAVVPGQAQLELNAGAGSTGSSGIDAVLPRRPSRGRVVPRRSLPDVDRSPRVILDLCAGSGSWSAPYEAAGYEVHRVTLPDADVRTYVLPAGLQVHGVLAGPPCDQFSLARNGHKATPRDLVRGMETVNACMRIIAQARPAWWALENPVGLLSRWLGTPTDSFEPCDFGDPWTKRTALWGAFTPPTRGPFVKPLGGGPFCELCDPDRKRHRWCNSAAHRAVTPPGFARAFFEANP